MNRADDILDKAEALASSKVLKLLKTLGTPESKQVAAARAKEGWRMTADIYQDKKGKPTIVSMTKGSARILIHPNGKVDTYADGKVPNKLMDN